MQSSQLFELKNDLRELKLATIRRELESSLRRARESGIDYGEFLLELTGIERQARTQKRLERHVKEARFPLLKPLEEFDLAAAPELDIRLLRELTTCEFIDSHRNVIFIGKSGTGKTHLATALGLEACKNNYRTRFVSCYGLVNELIEAREDRMLQRLLARYNRYDLLVLDELGYIPFSKEGAELLFQVLAERHERGSVIITTNLGFADWPKVFGDHTMTAALLDRVTHKAKIIMCNWESYRLRQSLELKKSSKTKEKGKDNSGQ